MKKLWLSMVMLLAAVMLFPQNYQQGSKKNSFTTSTSSTSMQRDTSTLDSEFSLFSSTASSNVFTVDPQLAMSSGNYPVTAGDVYTLAFVAGSTAVTYSIPVDSTYKIRVANLGVLDCRGLTYNQLKGQVDALVSRNYPMGGVQFVLHSPAVFLVSITGEVTVASEYKAWALTRLSAFINERLTEYASMRDISIVSADGTTKNYDLFRARRLGDFSQDPYLRPGDRVVVSRIVRKVTIDGAVERPGEYELLEGENLRELIEVYGGGLAPLADTSRIELYRQLTSENNPGEKSYLNQKNIDDNTALLCYDSVTVFSYTDLQPIVFVEGAVTATATATATALEASTRISATFIDGEDYAYFVRRNKAWFSAESDLANAYIIRGTETIPLDLNLILYDASYYANLAIVANDTLMIPFRQYFVSVAGSVNSPGRYPFIPDRTWEYYIGLAGGFKLTENAREKVSITDITGKRLSKRDMILPETTITAATNSPLYYFNQYAPVITTILSVIATSLSAIAVVNTM